MTLCVGIVSVINHDMTPTQGRQSSSRSGHPAQIYVDPQDWERFRVVAEAQSRSRSAQIRHLIRREIEQHDRASWTPEAEAA